MGQIEELEKELSTIKYQVNQIQLSLDRATNVVENIKRYQQSAQSLPQQLQYTQPVQPQVQPVQKPVQQPMQQQIQQPVQQPQAQPVQQAQPVYRVVQPGVPVKPVQQPATPQPPQQPQVQPVQQPVQQPQQVYQQPQAQPVQPQAQPVQPQAQPVQQTAQQTQQQYQQPVPQLYVPVKKQTSTESWIGKHLMGVLASVLIFIALILFASLIVPYLSDTIKIVMMFTVSLGITGFAYYEHKKRPQNTFFTALLACGLGCSYLSILVTRIYFEAINDIVMYILLLVWGAVVLYMGKRESKLFQVIGNAGFVISALLAYELDDEALVFPMMLYLVIMGAAHQFIFWKNEKQRNVQAGINLGILFFFAAFVCDNFSVCTALTLVTILLVVICAGYYAFFLFGDRLVPGANNTILAFCSAIALYAAYIQLGDCLNTPNWLDLVIFYAVAIVAQIALFVRQDNEQQPSVRLFSSVWIIGWLIIAEIVTYARYTEFFNTGALFIALLPVAIYGIRREHDIFKNQALILAVVLTALEMFGEKSILFCAVALAYALIVFVYEGIVINRSVVFKSIYYFYAQASIVLLFNTIAANSDAFAGDIRRMFVVIPVGLFNAAMLAIGLDRDNEGVSNGAFLMALNVINALGMLIGLANIATIDGAVLHGVNVAFTVALACVNIRRHFTTNNSEKLYAGIKFGIILLVSLISYDASGYVISVVTLAFAILCIVIGFNKTFGAKELRIYGLILSMICVVKFIMIDITYENTIGRAVSFLISGILCFGISAIYNHFEKQDSISNNN